MESPSLTWELFRSTATLAGGIAAFAIGLGLANRSVVSRNAALLAGGVTALIFATMNSDLARRWIGSSAGDEISRLGGPGTGAALGALIVIGAA